MCTKLNLNHYLQYISALQRIRRKRTDTVKAHKIFPLREKYSAMTNSILEGSYYEFLSLFLQQCLDTSSKQTQLVDRFVRTAEDQFEIFFPSTSKVPQSNLLIRMGHNLIHHGNFHGPHCNFNYCTC